MTDTLTAWATALLADLENIEEHLERESRVKRFTLDDLADGSDDHEELAQLFEDWADRSVAWVMDEKLDGSTWSDGRTVDLGSSLRAPEFLRIAAIGRAVRRELRA